MAVPLIGRLEGDLSVCTQRVGADPAVLSVARRRGTGLLVHPTKLFEVIAGQGIASGLGIHAIDARSVETEDVALDVGRQRPPAKALRQLVGHFQAAEGLNLPLRRSPPDRVGAPEDV